MSARTEMTLDRALDICQAICARAFLAMGLTESPRLPSLEDISLAEMLEAKRFVQIRNSVAGSEGGGKTVYVVPDDRLIAAVYVGVHYQPDGTAISIEPVRDDLGVWHMNAVGLCDVGEKSEILPETAAA